MIALLVGIDVALVARKGWKAAERGAYTVMGCAIGVPPKRGGIW